MKRPRRFAWGTPHFGQSVSGVCGSKLESRPLRRKKACGASPRLAVSVLTTRPVAVLPVAAASGGASWGAPGAAGSRDGTMASAGRACQAQPPGVHGPVEKGAGPERQAQPPPGGLCPGSGNAPARCRARAMPARRNNQAGGKRSKHIDTIRACKTQPRRPDARRATEVDEDAARHTGIAFATRRRDVLMA